ncbi:MAG: DUF4344 domain-containing metallopeptidase [Acidobacteriota bacterium]
MHRNLINLMLVALVLLVITACVCRSDRDRSEQPETPASSANDNGTATGKNLSDAQPAVKDEGDFTVEHITVDNAKYAEIDRQVRAEKLLENAADKLNKALILPHDIKLRTKDCGDSNAFYDPDDPSVTVCYELMEHFYQVFRSSGVSSDKAYDKMFDAVRFAFLHEIGHALIDTYKLPVTGNEEDAADRCSAYVNLEELGDDGVKAVFAAAEAFQIESKQSGTAKRDLADEHMLQEQRFYNSLCMIYGSNPTKYSNILTQGYLPKERAVRCESEYQRTADSWRNLLAPWRKR